MATSEEIRNWFAANPGASDAQIAAAMQANNVSSGEVASALGVDPGMVAQRYAAATAPVPAPAQTPTAAPPVTPETWQLGASGGLLNARRAGQTDEQYYGAVAMAANKWLANPGTAAEAFRAMSQSGISVSDLLNAGISQATIDNALMTPTDAKQVAVNNAALNSMTSTLAQNPLMAAEIGRTGLQTIYQNARDYVNALQQGGLTDAERNKLREAAAGQGWSYADIRAAGLDPMLLFGTPKPVVPPPQPPQPPVVVDRFPNTQTPYTPVNVYQPLPQQPDIYAAGQPALDVDFRNSPVRTVSPVTGQYMYTPAAKLRPATGAGFSWTPPVVTSRPRQLLDVGPTASASQLYAQSRQAQDRAMRQAFASRNLPMSGANTYYWQSRLRGGDYSPGGVFDPAAFRSDFDTWAASQPPPSAPTGGAPTTESLMPQMFLNMQPQMFADGGEATSARRMLERLKKAEGTEAESLGAFEQIQEAERAARERAATPLERYTYETLGMEPGLDRAAFLPIAGRGEDRQLAMPGFVYEAGKALMTPGAAASGVPLSYEDVSNLAGNVMGGGYAASAPIDGAVAGMAVKQKGGNWLADTVEDSLRPLRDSPVISGELINEISGKPLFSEYRNVYDQNPTVGLHEWTRTNYPDVYNQLLGPERAALNNWIDTKLARYIKNEMATPEDPVRIQADQWAVEQQRLLANKDAQIAKATADMEKARAERGFTPEMMTRSQAQIRDLQRERALIANRTGMHVNPEQLNFRPEMYGVTPAEGQQFFAQSPAAKVWEGASDNAIAIDWARRFLETKNYETGIPTVENNPWLAKVPPETPVSFLDDRAATDLGFDHMVDELKNALDPASGLPERLLIDPAKLEKMTVPQIVKHVDEINAWRSVQTAEANAARAANAATVPFRTYKTIPGTDQPNQRGLRWVELTNPKAIPEGYTLPKGMKLDTIDHPEYGLLHTVSDEKGISQIKATDSPENALLRFYNKRGGEGYKALEDALKYEGEILQHCVGGYCPDVEAGRSRIYSLRDAEGRPHVTIEVNPQSANQFRQGEGPKNNKEFRESQAKWAQDMESKKIGTHVSFAEWWRSQHGIPEPEEISRIFQIKGKQNLAPNAEYLPFVQDFVRSGQWSSVGDLKNTGLVRKSDYINTFPPEMLDSVGVGEYMTKEEFNRLADRVGGINKMADGGEVMAPQTESRSMLERLQRFASLDTPQDMSLGETVADIGMGFLPIVGTAQGARDFERARREDDTLGMVLGAASMIPVVGGAAKLGKKAVGSARQMLDEVAPLVMYRGLTREIDPTKTRGVNKLIFMTPDPQVASGYALNNKLARLPTEDMQTTDWAERELSYARQLDPEAAPNVVKLHVRPQNTFDFQNEAHIAQLEKDLPKILARSTASREPSTRREIKDIIEGIKQGRWQQIEDVAENTDFFEKAGFDSLYVDEGGVKNLGVFDPTLIKSAIGNEGTFDPTNPVITKADGGEVTTAELLAQMDRIGTVDREPTEEDSRGAFDAIVEAERRAARKPDPVQTESRGMLDRLNRAAFENVTQPVVGSLVDMTVGLGDVGQMATKYLAGRTRGPLAQRFLGADPRTGIKTDPVTPLAPKVREALGMSGYDPDAPLAVATQIALPALSRANAVGQGAVRAARMTTRAPRPRPGSAQELAQRIGGEAAAEGQRWVGSELGATIARDVAPGNTAAELLAAVAGSTAINTLQSLDPRDMSRVVLGMADYTGAPKPEYPFVGRLDRYVAENIKNPLTKAQFLGQLRGKFREYDILRAQRALEEVGDAEKLTPEVLLNRLGKTYDPADIKVTMSTGSTPYSEWDNPWKGVSPSTPSSSQHRTGTIVLSRGGEQGELASGSFTPEQVKAAQKFYGAMLRGTYALNPMDAQSEIPVADALLTPQGATELQDLISVVKGRNQPDVLDDLRKLLRYSNTYQNDARDIAGIGQVTDMSIFPMLFGQRYAKLLERGGMPPEDMRRVAAAQAYSDVYNDHAIKANRPRKNLGVKLPTLLPVDFANMNSAEAANKMNAVFATFANELLADRRRDYLSNINSKLSRLPASLENELVYIPPRTIGGSNPGYMGQHLSVTGTTPNQIAFSRFTDVETELGGRPVTGMYLHEMQSDLLDDIRTKGKRGEGVNELQARISAAESEIDKAREKLTEVRTQQAQLSTAYQETIDQEAAGTLTNAQAVARRRELDNRSQSLTEEGRILDRRIKSVNDRRVKLKSALRNAQSGTMPDLDEAFPGMEANSKALQQLMMKAAVAKAVESGRYGFVAFTSPQYSQQPQLYRLVPQNARDVVKDLGEGFKVEQIRLEGRDGPFNATAIVFDEVSAAEREGMNRVLTQGMPFAEGGEVKKNARQMLESAKESLKGIADRVQSIDIPQLIKDRINDTDLMQAKRYAEENSVKYFPKETEWGGEADALRHILFQSELANRMGKPLAKVAGFINEYPLNLGQLSYERDMDFSNDAIGREIGLSGMTQEQRLQAAIDAVKTGRATILTPEQQRAAPYRHGGEVVTDPEDVKNLLSYLDK